MRNALNNKQLKKALLITIDGPAGSGKSSAASALAARLNYLYLDTGALYRAIAWKVIEEKIALDDIPAITSLCHALQIRLCVGGGQTELWIDDVPVTPFLREPEITAAASIIASLPVVRKKLLAIQREIAVDGGVIAEGRDTGTVVFPDADLKFYLDADVSVRGKRRYRDLQNQGIKTDAAQTTLNLEIRDEQDLSRSIAPLKKGEDAILIDSTYLDLERVLEKMLEEVAQILKKF